MDKGKAKEREDGGAEEGPLGPPPSAPKEVTVAYGGMTKWEVSWEERMELLAGGG